MRRESFARFGCGFGEGTDGVHRLVGPPVELSLGQRLTEDRQRREQCFLGLDASGRQLVQGLARRSDGRRVGGGCHLATLAAAVFSVGDLPTGHNLASVRRVNESPVEEVGNETDPGRAAVDLLAELVRIDSVNPGLVAGAPGERETVEWLRGRLERAGLSCAVVAADDPQDRPSLLAWTPRRPGGRSIVLNGHVDTVGVDGLPDPFVPRVEGDRMFGRGTCDMLGGVAAVVAAAEELSRRDLDGQVVLALVADEEDRSLGSEAVLEALARLDLAPQVCLVAEPTWLALAESLRGYAVAEVTFAGRASHSSLPHEGVNAVTHLGRFLAALEGRSGAVADTGGSLMATVAAGGDAPFTIPATARVIVERRTMPGESPETVLDEIAAILADLREVDPDVDARSALLIARPPWALPESGPAAEVASLLGARLAATTGEVTGIFHAPYWMEAALWQQHGIPSLVCGPAGGGLHAVDEWVDLAQVRDYAVTLTETLTSWLGERDGD